MQSVLNFIQITVALLLVVTILLQVRGQGGGLFGGGGEGSYRTRRGIEKTLFQLTIVLIAVFISISIITVREF